MAFVLIVPSLAIVCEWIFRLAAAWMYPHQVCLPTPAQVAQKLMLLADKGTKWPYVYTRMNDAVAHVPLSSEGHIVIMTSGLPSRNAWGHLDQLWVWRLLQCRGQVACSEGLNGSLKTPTV